MPVREKEGFWSYDVGPTGKLLMLGRGDRMSPLIRFEDKKSPAYGTVFQIAFRKHGDKFIISR